MPATSLAHAAQAASAGLPVLFIDTCALLELVRFAERPRSTLADDLVAIERVRSAQTSTPPRLIIATSVLVHEEYVENDSRSSGRRVIT